MTRFRLSPRQHNLDFNKNKYIKSISKAKKHDCATTRVYVQYFVKT